MTPEELKDYYHSLEESYNYMKVLGMDRPVPLRDIFVRANILEKITEREFRKLDEIKDQFDWDKRAFGVRKETKEGLEVVNSLRKMIVLGKPGAGKTTFLKRVMFWAIDGELTEDRIPVFVTLKDFSESDKSLVVYLEDECHQRKLPGARGNFSKLTEDGQFIFLFDGLDEVGKDNQHEIIGQLQKFADQYTQNKCIISCRIAAYNINFQQFTDAEMADFDDQQIEQFISNWFKEKPEIGEECWQHMQKDSKIREIAQIPLLLTLLCITYSELLEFPSNRAELYEEAIDALLKKWDSSRGIRRGELYKGLSYKRKKNLLSYIAFQAFIEGEYFLKDKKWEKYIGEFIENLPQVKQENLEVDSLEVLQGIVKQHGIIVPRAKNIYSFSHLTFQEFFTANYLAENPDLFPQIVEKYIIQDQWRESFLLAVGMMDNADSFFLQMKQWIDNFAKNKLVGFLSQIPGILKPYHPYTEEGGRLLAIYV